VTLVFSVRAAVVPVVIGIASAALAATGQTWAWVVAGGFAVAALLATRRIELTPDAISFVPLLPLLGRQTLAWSDLGQFERSRRPVPRVAHDFLRAPVVGPARFRLLWLVPSRTVTFAAVFARSPGARPLAAAELLELIASVRGGGG
jgi:hypothetical protein